MNNVLNFDHKKYIFLDKSPHVKKCKMVCPCDGNFYDNHTSKTHKCLICGKMGFEHLSKDCPQRCPCGQYHNSKDHICFICKEKGYDHKAKKMS